MKSGLQRQCFITARGNAVRYPVTGASLWYLCNELTSRENEGCL